MLRRFIALVLYFGLALALAACGGDPTPEPTPEPTEEAVPEAEATAEAAAPSGDETMTVAAAIAAGDVENGRTVFNASYTTSSGAWMCASCHSISEDRARLVGPGLHNLYEIAETRLAESGDPDVVTYVRNAILHPGDHMVPDEPAYPENLMPVNYGEVLTEQELTDVIAYILTLGNPDA